VRFGRRWVLRARSLAACRGAAPRTTCCRPPRAAPNAIRRRPQLRPTAPMGHEGPNSTSRTLGWVGSVFWRDAQAGVPSARRPRAQLAFKNSMVHGILQFTPGIAFCYVLHRCESRDIRCRESCGLMHHRCSRLGWQANPSSRKAISVFLDAFGAVGFVQAPPLRGRRSGASARPRPGGMVTRSRSVFV
jgi:hypothetical protein